MNNTEVINKLDNLKKLREEHNITQVKLSTDLGVSQELISRYELGSSFPQPQMLIKLANYFNCSVDYLLGVTNIKTPIKSIDKKDIEISDIVTKYNSLSSENKKHLVSYLEHLIDQK